MISFNPSYINTYSEKETFPLKYILVLETRPRNVLKTCMEIWIILQFVKNNVDALTEKNQLKR